MGKGRTLEWAARASHLYGIPRRLIITSVGAFAKAVVTLFNTTTVHNGDNRLHLVRSRPPGVPLLTVSNHMSTLDDPLMWGFKDFPITDPKLARWLHTFPEGKVSQEDGPIRRLKWGTASLITRAPVTPIVLPIFHHGFHQVMPEDFLFGRRPPFPLINKHIKIIVGEPIEFDLPGLRKIALLESHNESEPRLGWPRIARHGLDEVAQRYLYSNISEKIQTVLESLRQYGNSISKQRD
uniref:Tafazzin family protein n=1 Tax=Chenopodium quinoa TaxID=63459 RepID=A0A803NCD7_CHEQI